MRRDQHSMFLEGFSLLISACDLMGEIPDHVKVSFEVIVSFVFDTFNEAKNLRDVTIQKRVKMSANSLSVCFTKIID